MLVKGTLLAYSEGYREKHYKNAGFTAGGTFRFQVNRHPGDAEKTMKNTPRRLSVKSSRREKSPSITHGAGLKERFGPGKNPIHNYEREKFSGKSPGSAGRSELRLPPGQRFKGDTLHKE
jgi:hypothetical protein